MGADISTSIFGFFKKNVENMTDNIGKEINNVNKIFTPKDKSK